MSFEDMPDRGQLTEPGAQDFVDRAVKLSKQTLATTRSVLDVDYGEDYYQKIDIFLPTNEGLPTQLEDCFDALAWAYRNIEQHGGSPDRIFVGGHSSGAHLAALMGLRKDFAAARSRPVDVVKGCFPLSGPHNLHFDEVEPGSRREKLLGDFLARPGDDRQASPIDHVAGNQTPADHATVDSRSRRSANTRGVTVGSIRTVTTRDSHHHRVPSPCTEYHRALAGQRAALGFRAAPAT